MERRSQLTIRLVPSPHHDYEVVDISIDGSSFLERIKKFESSSHFAEKESRSQRVEYAGLQATQVFEESGHFVGMPHPLLDYDGKVAVLDCTCGHAGCWPLIAKITIEEETITWSDFENANASERDYSAFGTFVFNRDQYELEMGKFLRCSQEHYREELQKLERWF